MAALSSRILPVLHAVLRGCERLVDAGGIGVVSRYSSPEMMAISKEKAAFLV
jgi:hypothetical protein